jgi:dTDP-4-dehydrorhamnose 3,5-epimerase
MKIIEVKTLQIPEVKVVRFGRFRDHRGYFSEPYRRGDFDTHPEMAFLRNTPFLQANESHSTPGVVRGLHFQWNPFMGKFVRTLSGRMVDLALDVRKGSPTLGKIIAYDMPVSRSADFSEWIWVPPGFAHGNYFSEESLIEYFCTGEYSPGCEGAVSPLAPDLDWSLCPPELAREFRALAARGPLISDKDKNAPSVKAWLADPRSEQFQYEALSARRA